MKQSVVIYDQDCGICRWTVSFIKKRARSSCCTFIAYSSHRGKAILNTFGIDFSKEQYIVYVKNKSVSIKSKALLQILRDMGGLWKIFYVLILIPTSFRDRIYNYIALNRYKFSKMETKALHNMRREYKLKPLLKESLSPDPFEQFGLWFSEAEQHIKINNDENSEANAMVISTASKSGIPSSRVVLLKHYSPDGFVFFTNYESRKGLEIRENNRVALLFFWHNSMRQVRIEGTAEKLTGKESDLYFNSRPRESQASSALSQQSRTLENREMFENSVNSLVISGNTIKRPDNWGGYIVKADYFEFWQGGTGRSHDRFSYTIIKEGSDSKNWDISGLYP